MIVNVRETLLDSDFSMCLATLLSYEPPEDISKLITKSIEIKKKIFRGQGTSYELKDDLDFDFEEVEGDQEYIAKEVEIQSSSAAVNKVLNSSQKSKINPAKPQPPKEMSRKKKFFPTLGMGLKKTSDKDHASSAVDLDIDIMPALNSTKNKKDNGKLASKVFRAKVMEEKKVRSTS